MSLTNISSINLNQEKGVITYHKSYSITPFAFPAYPKSKMRFCLVIISTFKYLQNSRFFEFIRNAFPNFQTIKNCHNLGDALEQISDPNKSSEILSKQLAIFDLSPDNQFGKIIPDIIPATNDSPFNNLFTHQLLHILVPNVIFGKSNPELDDKSYSYTIWIASKLSDLPEIIRTNSHLIFMTEIEDSKSYSKKYFGMEANIPPETIFSASSILTQDPQLMYLRRE